MLLQKRKKIKEHLTRATIHFKIGHFLSKRFPSRSSTNITYIFINVNIFWKKTFFLKILHLAETSFNLWILWCCFGSSVVFFPKSALLGYNLYTIELTYLQFQLLWQMCCVTTTTIKIGNIPLAQKDYLHSELMDVLCWESVVPVSPTKTTLIQTLPPVPHAEPVQRENNGRSLWHFSPAPAQAAAQAMLSHQRRAGWNLRPVTVWSPKTASIQTVLPR